MATRKATEANAASQMPSILRICHEPRRTSILCSFIYRRKAPTTTAAREATRPAADEARPEAPEVLPLLPDDEAALEPEPEPDEPEPEPEGREPAAVLEARPAAEPVEAEAEVGAAEDEGTSDLMPLAMVLVVLQFEVLGVE